MSGALVILEASQRYRTSAVTGYIGLLSDQTQTCPRDKGTPEQANAWAKKYKYLRAKVFEKRIPPNKARAEAGEVVHSVISLSDDPRVRQQLIHYQEHFLLQRRDEIYALAGCTDPTAPPEAASSSTVPPARPSLKRPLSAAILTDQERLHFGPDGEQPFAKPLIMRVDGLLPAQPPVHRTAAPRSRASKAARSS